MEGQTEPTAQPAIPTLETRVTALESFIAGINAQLAKLVETGASDAVLFIGKQIAAIEQHLATTPQAGGKVFAPAQPEQAAPKPAA